MFAIADMNFYSTGNLFFRSWCLIKDIIRTVYIPRLMILVLKMILNFQKQWVLTVREKKKKFLIEHFCMKRILPVIFAGANIRAGDSTFHATMLLRIFYPNGLKRLNAIIIIRA